eukprot:scaffold231518_cov31-Prasinocladus_malaysianus.AAC.1
MACAEFVNDSTQAEPANIYFQRDGRKHQPNATFPTIVTQTFINAVCCYACRLQAAIIVVDNVLIPADVFTSSAFLNSGEAAMPQLKFPYVIIHRSQMTLEFKPYLINLKRISLLPYCSLTPNQTCEHRDEMNDGQYSN